VDVLSAGAGFAKAATGQQQPSTPLARRRQLFFTRPIFPPARQKLALDITQFVEELLAQRWRRVGDRFCDRDRLRHV